MRIARVLAIVMGMSVAACGCQTIGTGSNAAAQEEGKQALRKMVSDRSSYVGKPQTVTVMVETSSNYLWGYEKDKADLYAFELPGVNSLRLYAYGPKKEFSGLFDHASKTGKAVAKITIEPSSRTDHENMFDLVSWEKP
ncbi:MAG TPA: hypothetical protein PLI95_18150 [Polyangiaceae bacterium]|nr:hypothetical protein [Polyangiaceae bacterium]